MGIILATRRSGKMHIGNRGHREHKTNFNDSRMKHGRSSDGGGCMADPLEEAVDWPGTVS